VRFTFVMEQAFEVLRAVKNIFDQHRVGGHDECDGDASLETNRT